MLDLGHTKIRLVGAQSSGKKVLEFHRDKSYWTDLEYWAMGFGDCKECMRSIRITGLPEHNHTLKSDIATFRAMAEADLSQLVEVEDA